ncbi:MAG TPA: gephyrin-like molybdotransferase Glp [Rhizomicrobium sp.]|jgi:molybdopterin molybdotransferase|nr:gephyrin-like molybdotransferase Glp [Rhizomicrobium sp.]
MISVEEAVARVTAAFSPIGTETIALSDAHNRVLANDVRAKLSQPPFPVSSMDGYAIRTEDAPGTLPVIGESQAGKPFAGTLSAREAVRIFTGAVVPDGADAIVIQEDTERDGAHVIIKVSAQKGRHIRIAGLDFKAGDVLAPAGKRLTARDLALIAAGDIANVEVRRRPRIAFAATGDELSRPGEPRKPGGIVASSVYGLSAMIASWGGEPIDLGLLPDTIEAFTKLPQVDADLIITLGGASVGDRDLVQRALEPLGLKVDFWKIAMRPGKPLIFGSLGDTPFLGLPGNPVSTLVCAMLFVRPAIAAMLGTSGEMNVLRVKLAASLPANDSRQDYIRARLTTRDGEHWAEPFAVQDSSMLGVLAAADALILRPPYAPAAHAGDPVTVTLLAP